MTFFTLSFKFRDLLFEQALGFSIIRTHSDVSTFWKFPLELPWKSETVTFQPWPFLQIAFFSNSPNDVNRSETCVFGKSYNYKIVIEKEIRWRNQRHQLERQGHQLSRGSGWKGLRAGKNMAWTCASKERSNDEALESQDRMKCKKLL